MLSQPPSPSSPQSVHNAATGNLTPPESRPESPVSSSSIFGSRSPSPSHLNNNGGHLDQITSEVPAIRRQHITDGYRAGISAGKDDPDIAQAGFDEGYPVGAALGMKVGWVLGMLSEAVRKASREGTDTAEADRALAEASSELTVAQLLEEMRERRLLGKSVEEIEEAKEQGLEISEIWSLDSTWMQHLPALNKWTEYIGKTQGSD